MHERFALVLMLAVTPALAASPQQLLDRYAQQAASEDGGFQGFSTARGERLYRVERVVAGGERTSCATCHTTDPRQPGRSRANKRIEPLAPAANPARFSDAVQVEKWFRRNCGDVLGRPCSAAEKGDFIAWLLTTK